MSLRDYGAVIWRRRWLVIVALVSATTAALTLTSLQTPVYSASSELLVQPRGQDGLFGDQVVNLNERAIDTEIQVIEGEQVRLRVQENLGLDREPASAEAAAVGQTDVIRITVRDSSASNAATLADAYAVAYIEVRREQAVDELLAASAEVQSAIDDLRSQIDALPSEDPRRPALVAQLANFQTTLDQLRVDAALRTGGAAIIRSAEVPSSPVEPTPARTAVFAAVIGLLIGVGAAFLIDYLDDKVRDEDELERAVEAPVLAVVPVDPPPDNRPLSISSPEHSSVEAYRGLRTNLQFLGLDRPLRVIQLTSSFAAEGKTTTSTNLAVVLAQAGHRVALVDADLRRPTVHDVMGVPQSPGLTDLLLGAESDKVVQRVRVNAETSLSVYPSGEPPSNPSEMLSGQRTRQLLAEMGEHYDYVIVDSAPVLPVTDSVALTTAADGVLVVAQAGRITAKDAAETMERLRRVSAPILGLVLNQAKKSRRDAYAYGGYGAYPRVDASDEIERMAAASSTDQDDDALQPER